MYYYKAAIFSFFFYYFFLFQKFLSRFFLLLFRCEPNGDSDSSDIKGITTCPLPLQKNFFSFFLFFFSFFFFSFLYINFFCSLLSFYSYVFFPSLFLSHLLLPLCILPQLELTTLSSSKHPITSILLIYLSFNSVLPFVSLSFTSTTIHTHTTNRHSPSLFNNFRFIQIYPKVHHSNLNTQFSFLKLLPFLFFKHLNQIFFNNDVCTCML